MAKKDKVYMPSGSGGLLRFGEEEIMKRPDEVRRKIRSAISSG